MNWRHSNRNRSITDPFGEEILPDAEYLVRLLIGILARYRQGNMDGATAYQMAQTMTHTLKELPLLPEGSRDYKELADLDERCFRRLLFEKAQRQERGELKGKESTWETL